LRQPAGERREYDVVVAYVLEVAGPESATLDLSEVLEVEVDEVHATGGADRGVERGVRGRTGRGAHQRGPGLLSHLDHLAPGMAKVGQSPAYPVPQAPGRGHRAQRGARHQLDVAGSR